MTRSPLALLALLPLTLHAQLPPTLAHYPLHGNAQDVSGSAFHGVVYGATFGPGPSGEANTAVVLDGNDHVDLSLAAVAYRDALAAATATFWVKFNDPLVNGQTVLSLGTFGENINTNVNEIIYDTDVLGLRTETTVSGIDHDHELDTDVEAGTWYHIAVVMDGTDVIYYLNGTEQRSFSYTPAETTTTNLFLGCFAGNTGEIGRYLRGSVSDLRLYGAALGPDDVEDVFNGITAGVDTRNGSSPLTLFPNPANDLLQLRLERVTGPTLCRILTADGRVVRETRLTSPIERLDVSGLPGGTYCLQVMDLTGPIAQSRFMKA
ncbi:MAG TPA: LamG-like jellyroll fold domain-containing protein [Flavobacteriales bacterium]